MPKSVATKLTEVAVSKLPTAPAGGRVEKPDLLAPGLFVRVNDKGRKTWMVHFRVNGAQAKMTLGAWPGVSLADARKLAQEVRQQADAGVDPRKAREAEEARARRDAETFADLAESFLAEWTPRGANTHREMAATIRLHLGALSSVPTRELHRSALGDVLAGLLNARRKGGPMPGAARKAYEAARRVTSWAVRRGKLEHDPFALMEPPAKGAPRERTLEARELALLWRVWEGQGVPFGPLQSFLLLTATRRNEAAEMTWRELDNADAPTLWTIPAERSKNGEPHRIPLSAQARAVLAGMPRGEGPFVFSTTDGMRPVSGFTTAKRRTDRMAAAAAEKAGAEPPASWSLHDLRRTARTGLARLGVPREIAERCLNHVGGSQLERTYNRFKYEAEIADAFTRWGAEVARIVGSIDSDNVVKLPARA